MSELHVTWDVDIVQVVQVQCSIASLSISMIFFTRNVYHKKHPTNSSIPDLLTRKSFVIFFCTLTWFSILELNLKTIGTVVYLYTAIQLSEKPM